MNSGEPAASDDSWLRPITNETHIRHGAVHHAQFKRWLASPRDPSRPWKLELSGRLCSLVTSVSEDADERVRQQQERLKASNKAVPSAIKYCGVLHAPADYIRQTNGLDCDVIYDPTKEDIAHAVIVIRDKGQDQILTVTEILLTRLQFLARDEISQNTLF